MQAGASKSAVYEQQEGWALARSLYVRWVKRMHKLDEVINFRVDGAASWEDGPEGVTFLPKVHFKNNVIERNKSVVKYKRDGSGELTGKVIQLEFEQSSEKPMPDDGIATVVEWDKGTISLRVCLTLPFAPATIESFLLQSCGHSG